METNPTSSSPVADTVRPEEQERLSLYPYFPLPSLNRPEQPLPLKNAKWSNWGCTKLGHLLFTDSLGAMRQAKALKCKNRVVWVKQFALAWSAYLDGVSRLAVFLMPRGVHKLTEERKRAAMSACKNFKDARNRLTHGRDSNIPAEIVTATSALQELELGLSKEPAALLSPPGLKYDDSTYFMLSLIQRWKWLEEMLDDAPNEMKKTQAWRDFRKIFGAELKRTTTLGKEWINEGLITSMRIKQTIDDHRWLCKVLDVFRKILEDQRIINEAGTAWWKACYLLAGGIEYEASHFLLCQRCKSEKLKGKDLPKTGQAIINFLEKIAAALVSQGDAPDLEESDFLYEKGWEEHDQLFRDGLRNTINRLRQWIVAVEHLRIPSNEPAVLSEILHGIVAQLDGNLSQANQLEHLWSQFNDQDDSFSPTRFQEYIRVRIKILRQAEDRVFFYIYGHLRVAEEKKRPKKAVKSREAKQPPILQPPLEPQRLTKAAEPLPIPEVPSEETKEPLLPPHKGDLLQELKGIQKLPIVSPEYDPEFRSKWKAASEVTIRESILLCCEFQTRGSTLDGTWGMLQTLHRLLEGSIERALIQYPIGTEGQHVLGQPMQGGSKRLNQEHNLQALVAPFYRFRADLPRDILNLLARDQKLIQSLARANVIATYPHWCKEELALSQRKQGVRLFDFIERLKKGITSQLHQELVNEYVTPTFRFFSDLVKLLQGERIANLEDVPQYDFELEDPEVQPAMQVVDLKKIPSSNMSVSRQHPLHPPRDRQEALTSLAFIGNLLSLCQGMPVEGGEDEWREQVRDQALSHCQLYLGRLSEKLQTNSSLLLDIGGTLDVGHTLLKELYVALIAHLPAFQSQSHIIDLKVQGTDHELRFHQNINFLHEIFRYYYPKEHLVTEAMRRGPASFKWPDKAHQLLGYCSAMKEIGTLPNDFVHADLGNRLEKLHGNAQYDEIRQEVDDTYLFPMIKLVADLASYGFLLPEN